MEGICKHLSMASREEGLDFLWQRISKRGDLGHQNHLDCYLKYRIPGLTWISCIRISGWGPGICTFNKCPRHHVILMTLKFENCCLGTNLRTQVA